MALLQITEPGQSTTPHQHRLSVGIDLGTTHSLVATIRSGIADILPDSDGQCLLPSVVRYSKEAGIEVGDLAKAKAAVDPLNTIASVKRLMGRGLADVSHTANHLPYQFVDADVGMPRINTELGQVSPVEVSAEILKVLRDRAQEALGGELSGVVITVPAYFDDAQRQATRDAARLAGLSVLRLLNEPTAAAVAYGLEKGDEGIHVIYDLGGGTFDVSILQLNKGVFEVLATAGDSALGGDDMDQVIAEWLIEQAGLANKLEHKLLRTLIEQARSAKELLTLRSEVEIKIEYEQISWRGVLTREVFEGLVMALVQRTLLPCRRALKDASITLDEIKAVVMVGGATRVPLVRNTVGTFFECQPLVDLDPDKVVALGAARQADQLVGNNNSAAGLLLLDVTPLSLGIATMGGLVEKIIPRNTPIPVAKAQEFTTFKDGQTAMQLHAVQGERELVDDCRSLAQFVLHGIPAMVAGAAKIKVSFQVDADGLLSVSAEELSSGVQSRVQVKPSYGLTDDEITAMLRDSMAHAADDVASRLLKEQQMDAERLLESVQAALAMDGERLLEAREKELILQAMHNLSDNMTGDDHLHIKKLIATLNEVSTTFAARRMDSSMQAALKGHRVDEIDL
ncbi:MAG: Fe-S protein assembly chaperone HscA [Gammaproteobacteria bacterium]|nr:Fe-S protein assembly chaperone HscA [Gammaproteobacteria bacterium]